MVDIKAFVERIFKQVKQGNKSFTVTKVMFDSDTYKCFTIKVEKSAISESFYNEMADNYSATLNDLPYILISKEETGVFISLLKLEENNEPEPVFTGQKI